MSAWQQYSDKFDKLTAREHYILIGAALFLTIYLIFTFAIEGDIENIKRQRSAVNSLTTEISTANASIDMFEQALSNDPNESVRVQIEQQKAILAEIDEQLLALTSDLINPIQMRMALIELLSLEQNVSLVSFEATAPQALYSSKPQELENQDASETGDNANDSVEQEVGLFKHGIKLTLRGRYQALQTYLTRLEQLEWKFFWQNFELKVVEYPNNELSVTIYSLSTKRDFIGV